MSKILHAISWLLVVMLLAASVWMVVFGVQTVARAGEASKDRLVVAIYWDVLAKFLEDERLWTDAIWGGKSGAMRGVFWARAEHWNPTACAGDTEPDLRECIQEITSARVTGCRCLHDSDWT